VPYGSAFEGEVVRRADMRVEFGGKHARCFEYLHMTSLDDVVDGKIELVGPDFQEIANQGQMNLGIVVKVAGRQMEKDFEPVLERQFHYFVNGASGIQHIGQRDITWIRFSNTAVEKGFRLEHLGKILHARLHADFGAIVDKVQITLYTDPVLLQEELLKARQAYDYRNKRLADLTDERVDEFYSCILCQSFAPNHVCVVSPERLGLCGAYNWLDCKASYNINPTGPNQPIKLGARLDPIKGYWSGINEFARVGSHGVIDQVSMYSIMDNPMTACLTEDTEVIVDGRPISIGTFVAGWKAEMSGQHIITLNGNGQCAQSRLLGVHKNPAPEKLIHIKTRTGLELTLTPNHEIAVDRWDHRGSEPWVRADELRSGDRLYAAKHLRLPAHLPRLVDLLPGDCRVKDKALYERFSNSLSEQFGSLAAGYRALGIENPHPRIRSLRLDTLRKWVQISGLSWDEVAAAISEITPSSGQPCYKLPDLHPDLFYLLGLLASDGSLQWSGRNQCRVAFTNCDSSLLDTYRTLYKQFFPDACLGERLKTGGGLIDGRRVQSTIPAIDLYGNNFLLGMIAEAFGVRMRGSNQWDLGRMVQLPEILIASFLAGVFDGDGSVRLRSSGNSWQSGEGYLCHTNHSAACHIQLLLKRLGILSNLRQDRTVFRVELHGRNLRSFATQIPSCHAGKREVLDQIKALPEKSVDKTQEQVLTYQAGKAVAGLVESQAVLSPSTLFYYKTGRSRPVAGNLRMVIEDAPETALTLNPYLENDFFLDTVTQVEVLESEGRYEYVYNLSLLDINSYLANGIHVKNCGCFECIVMLIPEANGVMVVSREDPSMTPCGMTFSTLAGIAGGGLQTPGVMGVGKYYLVSPKFILAEGGFKRVVWMSSILKETMAEELRVTAEKTGVSNLLELIADERQVTTVEELLAWLEELNHPALSMDSMF
jgi:CO dehydrogenase/acetyl-CoA synthase beta subunit